MKYLYPAIQPGFMVYSDEHIFVRMYREGVRFRVDHTNTGPAVFTKLFDTYLAASRHADRLVKASLKDRKQYSAPSHARGVQ